MTRLRSPLGMTRYSVRIATIGSTRAARRAGIQLATAAVLHDADDRRVRFPRDPDVDGLAHAIRQTVDR
jgi:hypothetical protein